MTTHPNTTAQLCERQDCPGERPAVATVTDYGGPFTTRLYVCRPCASEAEQFDGDVEVEYLDVV